MFAQWRHLSSLSHYAFHSCHCSMIWIPAGGLGERSLLAGQVNSCWLQIKCFVSLVFSLSCFFGPFSKALGGRCKAVQGNYSLSGNFHLRNHAKTQFKFSLTFWLICQRIQLLLDRRVSSALLGLVGEGSTTMLPAFLVSWGQVEGFYFCPLLRVLLTIQIQQSLDAAISK